MTTPKGTTFASAALRILVMVMAMIMGLVAAGCGAGDPSGTRVIVLGFDGMDYEFTRQMIERGRMPAFARLAANGGFDPLETTVPPQSPVAWSTFMTGLDPGGHGIFDFIHRDPETMLPYLSTTETAEGGTSLTVGNYQFPLLGGSVDLLRGGEPFWNVLADRGIESTIIRMPANYPPSGSATRELSGMGTPDLVGTYGTFSFYTSDVLIASKDIPSAEVHFVEPEDGAVQVRILGPDNPFLVEPEKVTSEFTLYLDPEREVAKLVAGDEERVLEVGEWTDWVAVDFELLPLQSLRGMVRFYLRQIEPDLQLYVTPTNVDPIDPALPISTPDSYAAELAKATGRFYTQGMPEETRGLQEEIFTRAEFMEQSRLAGGDVRGQYQLVLGRFDAGLLFYYFGNLDQTSHMLFRTTDPEHPEYDPETDPEYLEAVEGLYLTMDEIVAETLDAIDASGQETTLIVMSDHGFTSWRRAFHLNGWLRDNGYLRPRNAQMANDPGFLTNIDWAQTRAYGLGLNGLYLNLRGRERQGIVAPEARDALMTEIADKLLAVVDPVSGQPAITKVYRREEVYAPGEYDHLAPDLVVGYAKGTRCSSESSTGAVPRGDVIIDNLDPWSGDHCMDHEAVPGILLTNKPLQRAAPSLEDLAGAILAEFGVDEFPRPSEED
ncbi:MAG TPA: hypothetical protein DCP38_16595 [Acidobacteria bacterium]|jgi:predicted AlkP superfamily phosphohydrolase/phosphomutase|nr:alkaline phosphatase family protein [Vicinamibacterales bacterium]HAK57078.1 hypothetical protein [Acidobacteriota bacterium]|tara:strand:- start:1824 stop:3815 length:1992 start_codon:yes stop_codon:yes gene_type:complete